MADETDFAHLDAILSRFTALQKKNALLIEKQSKSIELLTDTVKEITIDLQKFDANVEKRIANKPNAAQIGIAIGPEQHNHFRSSQLKISRFCGDYPSAWISQIQRYFDFYNIPDHRRLTIASYYLDGNALDWYEWMCTEKLNFGWNDFLLAIGNRFGLSKNEEVFGRSSKLVLTSPVEECHHLFDQFSNKNSGTHELVAESFTVDTKNTTHARKPDNREEETKVEDQGNAPSIDKEEHYAETTHSIRNRRKSNFFQIVPVSTLNLCSNLVEETAFSLPHPLDVGTLTEDDPTGCFASKTYQQMLAGVNSDFGAIKRVAFLISAIVGDFDNLEHFPIFSLLETSNSNQQLLTLLAIRNCRNIITRDRCGSLKYWFSGTGCRWKLTCRRSLPTYNLSPSPDSRGWKPTIARYIEIRQQVSKEFIKGEVFIQEVATTGEHIGVMALHEAHGAMGIFRNSSLPHFLPTTSANHITQQVKTRISYVEESQRLVWFDWIKKKVLYMVRWWCLVELIKGIAVVRLYMKVLRC